uniref:Sugar transporter SWEET1 n=1 Tax=Phytophthora ramorum TaxID=164328 RepID=H3GF12_PHYRM
MTAYAVALEVSKVVTIITTLMMRVSLFPDWNRWRKTRNTGDMSVLPCVLIFMNSYASLYYAYATDDYMPLFATSMLGVVVGILLTYSFYRWAADQREVVRTFLISFVVCVVITLYDFLALRGATGQSHSSVETALGFIMVACTTGMYASPMATIVHVVRTKTATSMPFTMGVVNVLNSFCWGVYGALIHNMFLLIPNIIGVTLSLTQMLVTYIYRSRASLEIDDTVVVDVVVVTASEQEQIEGSTNIEHSCKSSDFRTTWFMLNAWLKESFALCDTRVQRAPSLKPKTTAMSAYAIAVTVSKVVTIITTVMMRISLLPDWNRWRKNHSTGEMSVMPCVLIFTNSYAVLFYAYAIDDFVPLFATSMLGVVVGIFLAYYFYRWAVDQREVLRVFAFFFFVCLVITIYAVLAICGLTGQSHSSVGTTLGFVTIATTTGMYASPMATIVRVVRTKTATSMPFTMGVVNVLNSFCWGVYGALVHNMFLLAPNIVGVSLSATQMIVTYMYRSKERISSSEDLQDADVLVISSDQDTEHDTSSFLATPSARTMSGADTAILAFKIITIVTTLMMRVSLLPDFQRMRKMKSTGDMSVLPCVLLYANCYLLCCRSSTGTTLGVLVIISSVGLYASPMATIRHVIRTKTSSSMPFTMGVVNVINSFCWVVYAALVDDIFILVPNASGALLGSLQLVLTFIYPRKAPSEGQIISATINDPRTASLSVVSLSPAQDNRENAKSGAVDGANFVALRSPLV